jgi:hypothetical protein
VTWYIHHDGYTTVTTGMYIMIHSVGYGISMDSDLQRHGHMIMIMIGDDGIYMEYT